MSDIPSFPYELLWGERTLRSVANLTRADGRELFAAVAAHPVKTAVEAFPLAEAETRSTDSAPAPEPRYRGGGPAT